MAKPHAKTHQKKTSQHGLSQLLWWGTGFIMGSIFTGLIFYKYPSSSEVNQVKMSAQKTLAEKSVKKPKFDFYTILPEMEVVLPQEEPSQTTSRVLPTPESGVKEQTKVPLKNESYVLQLASFKHFDDADQLKAQLALAGFEVNIEKVTLNDEVWHRVRLGPFHDQHKATAQQQKLTDKNISSLLLKLKG